MSKGLTDMINQGHDGFFSEQMNDVNDMIRDRKKYAAHRNQTLDADIQFLDNFYNCEGYVNSVETALIAMALSCIFSLALILIIERMNLLYYQSSEKSYTSSEDIVPNDRTKFLQTRNLKKTYPGKIEAVKNISFDLNSNQEILGLLGANGAGKSSTFNMVTM